MMRWITHDDGTVLWHDEEGAGDPPLVFVHGFSNDHTNFVRQIEHFSPRHRVVSVDLRGHGRSDAPDQAYTIDGFADDVAWLCAELGLERPILAGHSMGGMVVATLAEKHPELPGGIVILDAAPVPRPELVGALTGFADTLADETTFREDLRASSEAFFTPWDDVTVKKSVQDSVYAPRHVMLSASAAMGEFLQRALAEDIPAAWQAPACHIAASLQMNDLERFQRLCPELITAQTLGSGHWYMLDVPDQINAMLERFIEIVVAKGT